MLDLSIKGGSNCKDWAELPKDILSATGGVIQDVVVMLWCQHLQHLQICCCCMMMMEVTHALVAIDNDFVTAYWCLVEHSEDAPTQTTHYFDHQAHNWIARTRC